MMSGRRYEPTPKTTDGSYNQGQFKMKIPDQRYEEYQAPNDKRKYVCLVFQAGAQVLFGYTAIF